MPQGRKKTVFIYYLLFSLGFGFNIRGGVDHPHVGSDPGIFITTVRADSTAGVDGRLEPGDRILAVSACPIVCQFWWSTSTNSEEVCMWLEGKINSRSNDVIQEVNGKQSIWYVICNILEEVFISTVECWFFELSREMKIGSKNWIVQEIRRKIMYSVWPWRGKQLLVRVIEQYEK